MWRISDMWRILDLLLYKNSRDYILKNFPTLGSVGTLAVIQGATVAEW